MREYTNTHMLHVVKAVRQTDETPTHLHTRSLLAYSFFLIVFSAHLCIYFKKKTQRTQSN